MSINRYVYFSTRPQRDNEAEPWPLPQRATDGAFGYDLAADLEGSVPILPTATARIPTGLWLAKDLPADLAMMVLPRGSLAKKCLMITNSPGLVDRDYTGQILVQLTNFGQECAWVDPRERIAQLLFQVVATPTLLRQAFPDDRTERGGFGSTGTSI